MRTLQNICGVKRMDCIKNVEVWKKVGVVETVGVKMKMARLRYSGHVETMQEAIEN